MTRGRGSSDVVDADFDAVIEAERQLLSPAVRSDRAAVDRLLHPEFTEIGASGTPWTRAEILDAMHEWSHPEVVASEFVASHLGGDAIQLRYVCVGPRGCTRRSSLWQRDGSTWRIRFHQGTPARSDPDPVDDWDVRVADVWADAHRISDTTVRDRIRALVAERPDEARAEYELASAHDFAGEEAEAIGHYERAIARGLDDARRPQAVIQLASSLRNVDRADEAIAVLEAEDFTETDYASAALGFAALALADTGREREAVRRAVRALGAKGGPYARALTSYAERL